jgi:hypothetical protein
MLEFLKLFLTKKIIKYILIIAIMLRFFYLNYMNWKYGYFTTGIPGIQYWLDSDRYLLGAESILNGTPIMGRGNQYFGYMIFIALIKFIGLSLEFVIIFQIIISIIAAFTLFNLAKYITGNSISGYVAITLYMLNPFINTWHTFILTESLYSSFVIFSCWALYKVLNTRAYKYIIIFSIILLSTIFIRPNGWIFLPIFICFFIFYSKFKLKVKISSVVIIFFSFIIMANSIPALHKAITVTTPVDLMKKGEVIWGHPELRIDMPKEELKILENWSQAYKYIIKHPFSCSKLAFLRIGNMFIQIRSHHSTMYKAHMLLWIIPAYLLAFFGIVKYRKSMIIRIVLAVIIGHALIVALTYSTHESRFLIYILPIIYLLSGCGFISVLEKVTPFLLKQKAALKRKIYKANTQDITADKG